MAKYIGESGQRVYTLKESYIVEEIRNKKIING